MAAHAGDPRLEHYYREQWMSIKGLDAFYGVRTPCLSNRSTMEFLR